MSWNWDISRIARVSSAEITEDASADIHELPKALMEPLDLQFKTLVRKLLQPFPLEIHRYPMSDGYTRKVTQLRLSKRRSYVCTRNKWFENKKRKYSMTGGDSGWRDVPIGMHDMEDDAVVSGIPLVTVHPPVGGITMQFDVPPVYGASDANTRI